MMSALPKIVWHLDDPVADPALVPLYFVAKKAAEHVTVVLSGEGAEEVFGGYTIYREPLSLARGERAAHALQRGLRAVSRAIPEGVKGKSSSSGAQPRWRSGTTATPGSSARRTRRACCAGTTRRCVTPT